MRFRSFMLAGTGPSQLRFHRAGTGAARPTAWRYASDARHGGEPLLRICGSDDELLLNFPQIADFYVTRDCIRYVPARNADETFIELLFLGPVAALWLELNGIVALHASAVVVGDSAIAFLQHSGGGKSTLAASFLRRRIALLSDDVLAVSVTPKGVQCMPGYPQLRLAPAIARQFIDDIDALPPVHSSAEKKCIPVGGREFGSFCDAPSPISCIYVPQRTSKRRRPPAAHALTPSQALRELVRGSFVANAADALGWQSRRVRNLAKVAEVVPVKQLSYSSGMCYLDAVCDAVLRDLNATR